MGFIDHLKENTFDICLLITGTKVTQIAMTLYGMECKGSGLFSFEPHELWGGVLGVVLVSLVGYIYDRVFKSKEKNNYEDDYEQKLFYYVCLSLKKHLIKIMIKFFNSLATNMYTALATVGAIACALHIAKFLGSSDLPPSPLENYPGALMGIILVLFIMHYYQEYKAIKP